MKLDQYDSDVFDLAAEELKCLKQEDELFWEEIRNLFRYGVPSCDSKGHWTEFRIKVRPIQADIVAAIREKAPEGWFKTQGALYRCIVAAGCKTVFRLLGMESTEWGEILRDLNTLARRQRVDEFCKEMGILKGNIANGSMPPGEKAKVIDLIGRLERKIVGM